MSFGTCTGSKHDEMAAQRNNEIWYKLNCAVSEPEISMQLSHCTLPEGDGDAGCIFVCSKREGVKMIAVLLLFGHCCSQDSIGCV